MPEILKWLITSSENPEKTSTTVKGFLMALAPIALYALGIGHADFAEIVTSLGNVIFLALSLISAIFTTYGLTRKVKLGRWSAYE